MLWTILLGFFIAWSSWSLFGLYHNYQIAKTIGIPVVVVPVNSLNVPWLIFNQLLRIHPTLSKFRDRVIRKGLPFSYIGWQFEQGHGIHARLGPAFVLVSPSLIEVVIGEAAAAHNLLSRRKDFIKPAVLYDGLNVFGPNLNTAEGEVWQRHRRITAPSLNERISASVWQESLCQAQQMLDYWTKSGREGVSSMMEDTATLALNVLTACGFGEHTNFQNTPVVEPSTGDMTYRDAVMMILRRFAFLLVLPIRYLSFPFTPKAWKELGRACHSFEQHVRTLLEKEKIAQSSHDRGGNLLTNLIRASESERDAKTGTGLNDEEILGNMFIFTLAGHETTANTVVTAIVYLARYPNYQKWIREELESVLKDSSISIDEYEVVFPRLKRCLAVMYETLRLHGSIVFIPKATNNESQQLKIGDQVCAIPANTFVYVNNHAIQQDPHVWGDNSQHWLPERWISREDAHSGNSGLDDETLLEYPAGAFIPWADGPRVCPGRKFSQVEFVAVLATAFLQHQVTPVKEFDRQTQAETERKLDTMLQRSEISTATLQMKEPKMVRFSWSSTTPSHRNGN